MTRASGSALTIWRVASMPSRFGIERSMSTTVGVLALDRFYSLESVSGDPDELDVVGGRQQLFEAAANDRVIVCDHHPNGHVDQTLIAAPRRATLFPDRASTAPPFDHRRRSRARATPRARNARWPGSASHLGHRIRGRRRPRRESRDRCVRRLARSPSGHRRGPVRFAGPPARCGRGVGPRSRGVGRERRSRPRLEARGLRPARTGLRSPTRKGPRESSVGRCRRSGSAARGCSRGWTLPSPR